MRIVNFFLLMVCLGGSIGSAQGIGHLTDLDSAKLECEIALWVENPIEKQFLSSTRVVVADLRGRGRIEIIHFAMPGALKLGREAILRMFWDGETSPSVECPEVAWTAFSFSQIAAYAPSGICGILRRRDLSLVYLQQLVRGADFRTSISLGLDDPPLLRAREEIV